MFDDCDLWRVEEREFVLSVDLDGDDYIHGKWCRSKIYVVESSFYEIPLDPVNELHSIADCGSVGWAYSMWAYTSDCAHGSHSA